MESKSVGVKILESTSEFVKVELPFVNVPVRMNYEFFNKRLEDGYFHVLNSNESPFDS